MNKRLRFILPTLQVIIAITLIASNNLRPDPGGDTIPDSRVYAPDIQACWAVNSPAAMLARIEYDALHDLLWTHYPIFPIVILGTFFSLVWLLWYAVSIEIGGKGVSVIAPQTRFRRLADILAIALGVGVVFYADIVARGMLYERFVTPVHLLWALAIVGFYGHDLWASFRAAGSVGRSESDRRQARGGNE